MTRPLAQSFRDDLPAVLRETARAFDAPAALLAPNADVPHRAYASAPVTSADGEFLGTLCILGVPGVVPLTSDERVTLAALADRIAVASHAMRSRDAA